MTDGLRISARVVIPENELQWRFSRSSGAGGQHVNKTSTRVELVFDVVNSSAFGPALLERALERLGNQMVDGVLTVVASDRSSQFRNRMLARERFADTIRKAIAPPPRARRPTKPTFSSKKERVDTKRKRGDVKKGRQRPSSDD